MCQEAIIAYFIRFTEFALEMQNHAYRREKACCPQALLTTEIIAECTRKKTLPV